MVQKQMSKFSLPDFLEGTVSQEMYRQWIQKKASTHVRRDRKRGNKSASISQYKKAIHDAVVRSQGNDCYTGEKLDWRLISKYDNAKSKAEGRKYKRYFYLLPTLDHVSDGKGKPDFEICAWMTNDAKNDMSYDEFIELCKKVVENNKSTSFIKSHDLHN